MTLDLAKLRALADGAVKGPWTASHGSWSSSVTSGDIQVAIANLRNSEFIAAARTAIPALLDEVERLRQSLRYLRRKIDGFDGTFEACGFEEFKETP